MNDGNPFRSPFDTDSDQTSWSSAYAAQKTSALAILAVVSGLLSFPMMCLCFISIPFSVFAIVCGHMARGIIRESNGEYGNVETATLGLVLGYTSLLVMGTMLALPMLWRTTGGPGPTITSGIPATPEQILLKQAEGQLLGRSDEQAMGVSTTDGDARSLASHYIETLNVLDATFFEETSEAAVVQDHPYRVFVQLNDDGAAFLIRVPDLNRFTPAALETLRERCWLIAQRSVDDVLPEGAALAVAIYSDTQSELIMIGVTARSNETAAGLDHSEADSGQLASFFRLPKQVAERAETAEAGVDSKIDNKATPGGLTLPPEAE